VLGTRFKQCISQTRGRTAIHSIDHLQADIGIAVQTLPSKFLVTHSSVSLSVPECGLQPVVNRTVVNNPAQKKSKTMVPLSVFHSFLPTNEKC
jgi:hypothetical protein